MKFIYSNFQTKLFFWIRICFVILLFKNVFFFISSTYFSSEKNDIWNLTKLSVQFFCVCVCLCGIISINLYNLKLFWHILTFFSVKLKANFICLSIVVSTICVINMSCSYETSIKLTVFKFEQEMAWYNTTPEMKQGGFKVFFYSLHRNLQETHHFVLW